MSLSTPATIDAVMVRDGWAVVAIYHFDGWDDPDALTELLRHKLATVESFVRSPSFLSRFHRSPVAVELNCSDAPPASVLDVCRRAGVRVPGFD